MQTLCHHRNTIFILSTLCENDDFIPNIRFNLEMLCVKLWRLKNQRGSGSLTHTLGCAHRLLVFMAMLAWIYTFGLFGHWRIVSTRPFIEYSGAKWTKRQRKRTFQNKKQWFAVHIFDCTYIKVAQSFYICLALALTLFQLPHTVTSHIEFMCVIRRRTRCWLTAHRTICNWWENICTTETSIYILCCYYCHHHCCTDGIRWNGTYSWMERKQNAEETPMRQQAVRDRSIQYETSIFTYVLRINEQCWRGMWRTYEAIIFRRHKRETRRHQQPAEQINFKYQKQYSVVVCVVDDGRQHRRRLWFSLCPLNVCFISAQRRKNCVFFILVCCCCRMPFDPTILFSLFICVWELLLLRFDCIRARRFGANVITYVVYTNCPDRICLDNNVKWEKSKRAERGTRTTEI